MASENKLDQKQRRCLVGRRIKDTRERKGISQMDLAAGLECTQGIISQYETGYAEPSLFSVIKICDELGCSLDYLLGRDTKYGDTPRARVMRAFEQLPHGGQVMVLSMLEAAVEASI